MVYAERQELLYWIKQVPCQIHYSFASKCPVADVWWEKKIKNEGTSVLLFFNLKAFSTALLYPLHPIYSSLYPFFSHFIIQMLE